jgi:nucleoside-diphosphate-sugar epimerase
LLTNMRILVTGAAGLIGGDVAVGLARRGHAVTALVNRRRAIIASDGNEFAARADNGRPAGPGEIVTMAGDVRQPNLGLHAPPRVDLVIHSAAITAFDADEAAYRSVNIDGTRHAVALAAATGARLLQVSTAYVCGNRDGRIGEAETGSDFVNGYEASKAAGEAIVRAAMAAGLVAAISRPSIVVGDSAHGAIREFTNIYSLFRLIASGLLPNLPAAPGATLDLVPIDHVVGGIIAMAEDMAAVAGRTLHLVADQPTPLADLAAAIGAVPGLGSVRFVDPAEASPLPRRIAAVAGLYTPYLMRGPRFDTTAAAALLPPCPATDRAWLGRLIGHCLDAGFVSARRDIVLPAFSA